MRGILHRCGSSVYDRRVTDEESQADQVYKWTIRLLYGTAIALNVWMLWQAADESDVATIKRHYEAARARVLAPIHARKHFRRQVGHVIYEAMEIVDEANPKEVSDDG
jgi:hypothetical protein